MKKILNHKTKSNTKYKIMLGSKVLYQLKPQLVKNLITKKWHVVGLFILCFAVLLSHLLYVSKTYQYPEMDEHLYMNIAVEYYRLLQHPSSDTIYKMNKFLIDNPPFRPPVYPLSITAFLLFLGLENSYKIALAVNGLYYVLTIIGIYLLGREFLSRTASFFASLIFAFYGWSLFYLHFTYSETAATTIFVFGLLFLVRSRYFTNRKNSILFGIFLSVGFMTRWLIPIFLAGPILLVLYKAWRNKLLNKKSSYINLLYVFAIFVPSIIFHYVDRSAFGTYITSQMFYSSLWDLVPSYRKTHISFQSAAYYFKVFEQLNIFFFLLFISGLVVSFLKRKWFFFITFFTVYMIFSFGTVIKDDRYIVPIYPIIALISATVLDHIKNIKTKVFIMVCVVLLGVGNLLGASWGLGPLGHEGLKSILLPMPVGHPRRIHLTTIVWPPTRNFSNAHLIMQFLKEDSIKSDIKEPYILYLFSYHPLDNALFSINRYQNLHMLNNYNFVGLIENGSEKSMQAFNLRYKRADYVVLKKGGIITDTYFQKYNYDLLQWINNNLYQEQFAFNDNFKLIGTFSVPIDNSKILIYKRSLVSR